MGRGVLAVVHEIGMWGEGVGVKLMELSRSPPHTHGVKPTSHAPPARPAQDGVTGLILAARNGHVEVARLLLDRGANVNAARQVRLLRAHVHTSTRVCVAYVCTQTRAYILQARKLGPSMPPCPCPALSLLPFLIQLECPPRLAQPFPPPSPVESYLSDSFPHPLPCPLPCPLHPHISPIPSGSLLIASLTHCLPHPIYRHKPLSSLLHPASGGGGGGGGGAGGVRRRGMGVWDGGGLGPSRGRLGDGLEWGEGLEVCLCGLASRHVGVRLGEWIHRNGGWA